jgi:hypothetical protein
MMMMERRGWLMLSIASIGRGSIHVTTFVKYLVLPPIEWEHVVLLDGGNTILKGFATLSDAQACARGKVRFHKANSAAVYSRYGASEDSPYIWVGTFTGSPDGLEYGGFGDMLAWGYFAHAIAETVGVEE